MKKIIAALLASTFILSLSACSSVSVDEYNELVDMYNSMLEERDSLKEPIRLVYFLQ